MKQLKKKSEIVEVYEQMPRDISRYSIHIGRMFPDDIRAILKFMDRDLKS